MSRGGREVENEEIDNEEMGANELDVNEYKEEGDDTYNRNLGFDLNICNEIDEGAAVTHCIPPNESRPDKIRKCDANLCLDHQWRPSSSSGSHRGFDLNLLPQVPQDADYYNFPQLNDQLVAVSLPRLPFEVETMIIARTPLREIRRLCSLNKSILALIKSGELVKVRKEIGVREALIFMLASGERNWWAFDQKFTAPKILPELPSDYAFTLSDKETLCAGSHLLVFGREVEGAAIWTYELFMNKWFKTTPMVESRCLFASASSGDFAYLAGGISPESGGILNSADPILNSAEKYDPVRRSWEPLPAMKEKRRMSAGVYMDNKFYVIGGQNQNCDALTCGEVFDEAKNTWAMIPGILNGLTTTDSPPLVAVVHNELYTFETSTNSLMVYLKATNSWKGLGPIPVRADKSKGWGVAFKSLGNELLVIGESNVIPYGRGMTVFTCCPNPNAEGSVEWKLLNDGRKIRSSFVMNCTAMLA